MTFTPPTGATERAPSIPPRRPDGLTVLLILLWMLEGVVALFALSSLLSVVIQLVNGPANTGPRTPPVVAKISEEMFWAAIPHAQVLLHLVQLTLCGFLIYVGIQVFRGNAGMTRRFSTLLLAAAGFSVLKFLLIAALQWRMSGSILALANIMATSASAKGPLPPHFDEIMRSIVMVGIIIGVGYNVVVLALKLVVYLSLRANLGSPRVKAFLGLADNAGEASIA